MADSWKQGVLLVNNEKPVRIKSTSTCDECNKEIEADHGRKRHPACSDIRQSRSIAEAQRKRRALHPTKTGQTGRRG